MYLQRIKIKFFSANDHFLQKFDDSQTTAALPGGPGDVLHLLKSNPLIKTLKWFFGAALTKGGGGVQRLEIKPWKIVFLEGEIGVEGVLKRIERYKYLSFGGPGT